MSLRNRCVCVCVCSCVCGSEEWDDEDECVYVIQNRCVCVCVCVLSRVWEWRGFLRGGMMRMCVCVRES